MIMERSTDKFELECQSAGCEEVAHFFVDFLNRGRWLLCDVHRNVAIKLGGTEAGTMR